MMIIIVIPGNMAEVYFPVLPEIHNAIYLCLGRVDSNNSFNY